MPHVCILTDQTAVFDVLSFPGNHLVYMLTNSSNLGFIPISQLSQNGKYGSYFVDDTDVFSVEKLREIFHLLALKFNEIVVILTSAHVHSSLFDNISEAAEYMQNRVAVQIIDSQTLGSGLANIVQKAAKIATEKPQSSEIYRQTRNSIAHVYTIFSTNDLSSISSHGKFDQEHAVIGEMLNITPIMILENTRIVATQKARNARHLVEIFLEFLEEFYSLKYIYLYQSNPVFGSELTQLKERLIANYPEVVVNNMPDTKPLRNCLGNPSICMIIEDE